MSASDPVTKSPVASRRGAGGRGLRSPIVAQFIKFGLVGVSNTVIAFGIYTVLLKAFGVWYIAASGIGFAVGAVNGFLLNRSWTFRGHAGGSNAALRWMVVQGCGLMINLGLVYLLVSHGGMDKLSGQAIATAIVVVLTFFVNRRWTFRVHLMIDERGELQARTVVVSQSVP
jgi:putative flippase GtrA